MTSQPTCFVVMPYGKRQLDAVELDFDAIFEEYIQPATSEAGFKVVRGDQDVASGVILPRLFSSIYSADLVIADVTYQNPNVYYELGVRHALREQGTLLIRRVGGDLGVDDSPTRRRNALVDEPAFDIRGITIWPYEVSRDRLPAERQELRRLVERVASAVNTDSPAFLHLHGLRVAIGSPRALARDDRTYEVLDPAGIGTRRFVGYRSGDLREQRGERAIDYWVNSENVLMQMARIYERSVSSTIRFLGSFQPDPTAPDFEDTIANDLAKNLGNRHAVDQGEVIVTTSGRLQETHGVKAILHAATVTGAPGRGFQPIPDDLLIETTRTVLARARDLISTGPLATAGRSLIMPLFGTGQGRLDPRGLAESLVQEVVQDLAFHASTRRSDPSDLAVVLFSTFTKDHVTLLRRLFERLVEDGALRAAPTYPTAG